MKIKLIVLAIILPGIVSCKNDRGSKYSTLILGEWSYIRPTYKPKNAGKGVLIAPPIEFGNSKSGYQFFVNNTCDDKLGFFRRVDTNDHTKGSLFLGNYTRYIIKDTVLQILDPSNNTWVSKKIVSLNADTLRLDQYGGIETYIKKHYPKSNTELFDQLIISTSGCEGTCPINNTIVDKGGDFVYLGEYYNTKTGFYRSNLPSSAFKKIEEDLAKANIAKLDRSYASRRTDQEQIALTLVKHGQIIKTISDYGRAAPVELYWAYTPIRYLYQRVKLDTLSDLPIQFNIGGLTFRIGNKICDLQKSESFYLWNLLRLSKRSDATFSKKYDLKFRGTDQLSKIETDGQFYRFVMKNGEQRTFDLGFNFILKNKAVLSFRDKSQYD